MSNSDEGYRNSGQAFEADLDAITEMDGEITEEERQED